MSKIEDVSEAIADETEIAAIEEAGIIAQRNRRKMTAILLTAGCR